MKKKIFIDIILILLLAGLVIGAFFLYTNLEKKEEKEKQAQNQIIEGNDLSKITNEVYSEAEKGNYDTSKEIYNTLQNKIAEEKELEDSSLVAYSDIQKNGYESPEELLQQFVTSFNDSKGEILASITDLFADYIYGETGKENFDDKYSKLLLQRDEYEDFVSISVILQAQEKAMIEELNNMDVDMSLENVGELTKITSSRYLYEIEADIKIVDKQNNVDRTDKMLFTLLKLNNVYYIINYIQK